MFNKPTTTTQKIEDHLAVIQSVAELAIDPQPLLDLHKLARDEATLTEEQANKYSAALDFIDKYEGLAKEIKDGQDKLKNDQDTAQGDEQAFRKWRDDETERLKKQKEEQDVAGAGQSAYKKKLNDAWVEMESKYSDALKPIETLKAQAQQDADAAAKELAKQKKITAKLEAKALKVKKAIQAAEEDEEQAA